MRHPVALCAAAVGLLLLAPVPAGAHGLEPALLSLHELTPGRFEVVWQSSKLRLPGAEVLPILPETCRQTTEPPQIVDERDRLRLTWTVDCGLGGLAGKTIGVADLDVATIDALLKVELLGGPRVQTVLTARQPTWTAPADHNRLQMLWHYARLGASHLLDSPDRVLLALGLLLLVAPAPRRMLQATVAFAVGHGVGLVLVATGLVAVPMRAVDLLIAAAVLLLALELVGGGKPIVSIRRVAPVAALAFGVLAGAGFAGTLVAAGMPSIDAPLALLAFNAGIEICELSLLAAAVAVGIVVAHGLPRAGAIATRCAAYGMGILAVFWCLERLAA